MSPFSNVVRLLAILFLLVTANNPVSAADGRTDYDLDDDGLIEIYDLADLNEIRNNLDGTALYGVNTGCPAQGCNGFELTTDLDFDTNGDGLMDANDTYWNSGSGWEPIGTNSSSPFSAVLEGNGHLIKNLYIDRTTFNIGLFGYGQGADIRQVGLTGSLMLVNGGDYVGALSGSLVDSYVTASFTTGAVSGNIAGGLVGKIDGGGIRYCFSTGSVTGNSGVGGLVGSVTPGLTITASFSSVAVNSPTGGGLAGSAFYNSIISSYWATDTSGQNDSPWSQVSSNYLGDTLIHLKCPTSADDVDCSSNTLYVGWADYTYTNSSGTNVSYWDFGTDTQLPGLNLNGKIYRDSDGDGTLDGDDVWPELYAASTDTDGDAHPDAWSPNCDDACITASGLSLDNLPDNTAAWLDEDLDGLPDSWPTGCDNICQNNSGLTLDTSLNDTDNDGITNDIDTSDNDPTNTTIDADYDSDGLIDISSLEQLDAIRNELNGIGRVLTHGGTVDSSGCQIRIYHGTLQSVCRGYELTTDLDFDTNGDGLMDASDAYWNSGSGWNPIGNSYTSSFSAIFEGNGHLIRNLYIDRNSNYIGLIGYASEALIQHLGLTGELMQLSGISNVGSIAGVFINSTLISSFSTGSISSTGTNVGGLVGNLSRGSSVSTSFSTGALVSTGTIVGGIAGYSSGSDIKASLFTGAVFSTSTFGGIVGKNGSFPSPSYWSTDTTGQSSVGTYGSADILVNLQCPTSADNNTCSTSTLYRDWATYTYTNNLDQVVAYWDFGTSTQLPGLNLNGVIYRDSDGDGTLDEDDIWPEIYAASRDSDGDGYPDAWSPNCDDSCIRASGLILDNFPDNVAVWQDEDLDGLPDSWAVDCDSTCQTNSGLALDTSLSDTDNDGITNDIDTSDNDPTNTSIDADADSDGLIDINSLEQLNAMRYQLNGVGRVLLEGAVVDSSGCPARIVNGVLQPTCRGYELTTDLDFDTNSDGVMDINDTYWNSGSGWDPIGNSASNAFSAVFEGNGHIIRNLYINQNSTHVGLFGYTFAAEIRQVGLTGEMMQVNGVGFVGSIVGYLYKSSILASFSTGSIIVSGNYGGALVGKSDSSSITASFASGSISSTDTGYCTGGLVGYVNNGDLSANFASGAVSSLTCKGGISGAHSGSAITNSYWSIDTTGQINSQGSSETDNYIGDNLNNLQCPTSSDDSTCSTNILYVGWADYSYTNSVGQTVNYWDFGTDTQLPGLNLNGTIYRDSDGDGTLDGDDVWPDLYAASTDTDGDGHPDAWSSNCDDACISASGLMLDNFPDDVAVWQDDDLDGLPDSWAISCDSSCQTNSGFILDTSLNDTDNDGITNDIDISDNDPTNTITDADADSDGLIDINNLEQLNAMRFELSGIGRVLTDGGAVDSSGCPARVVDGVSKATCRGYELTTDLDFDTNSDGVMDVNDTYWNAGSGWLPVGMFEGEFQGNGFQIRNLYIRRTSGDIGFFSGTANARLNGVVLTGPLMEISGQSGVGALVGRAYSNTVISGIITTGVITSSGTFTYTGGIVGRANETSITASFSSSSVTGSRTTGGLVGQLFNSTIDSSLATGALNSSSRGGLIGSSYNSQITNSYWAIDTAGVAFSPESSADIGYLGETLANLQCPVGSDDNSCSDKLLYAGWSASGLWDFGTTDQLPGLNLNGVIYRDSDGDGYLDADDHWPENYAASKDVDADGYPDTWSINCDDVCAGSSGLILDNFPDNDAAGQDEDLDGLPDSWAAGCDSTCQDTSGLTLIPH